MIEILEGPHAIALGVEMLGEGKFVVFPTETVYGLGADALDASAVESVFALKGRPASNPLIVHVSGIEMAKTVVADWPREAQLIAEAHWPGPVTMVLPKADGVPGIVCADGPTVAVRCPAHPCALALIEAFAKPIVGPSANPSGRISPTTPEHVADGFPDADLIVIDGGHCRAGIESTVVDLSGEVVRILRPGIIGAHAISETIGQPVECTALEAGEPIAKSPGVVGAHYQPLTPTRLVGSAGIGEAEPGTTLIAWSISSHPSGGTLIQIPSRIEPYAGGIYKALHDADRVGTSAIWVEEPPAGSGFDELAIRAAVMERLGRATHP
jgi:L-threonylcarbamoyladenylate synthase